VEDVLQRGHWWNVMHLRMRQPHQGVIQQLPVEREHSDIYSHLLSHRSRCLLENRSVDDVSYVEFVSLLQPDQG
jgi:hypothetical protein